MGTYLLYLFGFIVFCWLFKKAAEIDYQNSLSPAGKPYKLIKEENGVREYSDGCGNKRTECDFNCHDFAP